MAAQSWYRVGTAALTNASTTVTGTSTGWNAQARSGDMITFDAGATWYEVAAVVSNTVITLATAYAGATASGVAYAINRTSPLWSLASELAARVALLLDSINLGLIAWYTVSGSPSSTLGEDGDYAIDPTARFLYGPKAAGSWPAGVSLGGADGADGADGTNGTNGIDGSSAGIRFVFKTSTTMGDPGDGALRFNNATLASVTAIAIDDKSASAGNPSVSPVILTWDDSASTPRGVLTIKKTGADNVFAVFNVTGSVTNNTTWLQLAVTHVASAGSFAADDSIAVEFARTGDVGSPGTPGTNGTSGTNGTNGADGISAGLRFAFKTSTTMGDPGDGGLRFNNATYSSVTAIAIDDKLAVSGNPSIAAFVNLWDDALSTWRGYLLIRKVGAEHVFAMYRITGAVTDNTSWLQVPVAYAGAGSGTFAADDPIAIEFVRTGEAGVPSGFTYVFKPATSMSDPSAPYFKLNNAALASVTAIALSYGPADGAGTGDVSAVIKTWDDSTSSNRGALTLKKVGAEDVFAVYAVTGTVTDNGVWFQLSLTHVASNGSFAGNDLIAVQFARTGDAGSAGGGDLLAANNLSDLANKPTACTNLGLGTGDSPQHAAVNIGHATDTTLSRLAAGRAAIEGGLIPAQKLFRLNADLAGSNATGAQSLFGKGVTLQAGTVYAFEMSFTLAKAAGTTSHTITLSFGGTATLNNIYILSQDTITGVAAGTGSPLYSASYYTAGGGGITNAITLAATETRVRVSGTVSINAAGTFIPQYALSAAPGGAYSTKAGSIVAIWPIGAAGADVNVGSWA